ncbi:tripartite tricarboxylate transporter TctB family protein [Gelria sp. Kuro-4]|uniref:tripartite tricarboxylate transporter TctB family protein n=1 Tax=Gelria sp. Kuro-4 TaxID=2796927 RepID=UPI001BEEACF0|nr:tripartite tricarboxylate transporter TctB family protein [Gelria sp. Kuro-4]BCV24896.1 hypothetical protein kuro4_16690 [Gelria sp. Kuro-4]
MPKSHDRIIALLLLVLSLLGLLQTKNFPERVGYFPAAVLAVLLVLSVLLFFGTLRKDENKQAQTNQVITTKAMFTFAVSVLCVLLINVVGLYIASGLLIAVLAWYFRGIQPKSVLLAIIVFNLFTYLLFSVQLQVPIPAGILFRR